MYPLVIIYCLIGAALPTSALSGGMQSLLITFFGLLSAGLVPAIILLVTTQVPSHYTVAHIEKLEAETDVLFERLISTLGVIVLGGVATLIAGIGLPTVDTQSGYAWLDKFLLPGPQRVLQAVVFACFAVGLDRLRVFVSALRTARNMRRDLALDEARQALEKKAPQTDAVRSMFRREAGFGARVSVLRKPSDEGDG